MLCDRATALQNQVKFHQILWVGRLQAYLVNLWRWNSIVHGCVSIKQMAKVFT